MSTVALDIGTYSIKAAIGKTGLQPAIEKVFEVLNPICLATPTDDAQLDKMQQMVSALWQDYSLPRSKVALSMPESVVSTKVIDIPPLSDSELASAIHWQAERHIPIPKEELTFQYQVLSRPANKQEGTMKVLLVGVRKATVERYLSLFEVVGIEPWVVETQALSVFRNVAVGQADPATLIVHIGAAEMTLQAVQEGTLDFVVTHVGGGSLLTKALQSAINLDGTQAEQYVRAYGLDEAQFDGKIRAILLPQVQQWLQQVRIAMQFFANQHPSLAIQRIILSGGVAALLGFPALISAELGVEVLVVAPFGSGTNRLEVTNNPTSFSVAMGLMQYEE